MNLTVTWGGISLAAATEAVSALALDGARAAQVQQCLRAANAKVIDRRNSSRTLAFTVTRAALGSVQLAQAFLFAHQLALDAATATADAIIVLNPGGAPTTYTLKNAVLTALRGRHVGVTTIHDYTFTGGLLVLS
jgi:hypothetical protein